jgi:hypothetical protein
MVSYDCNGTRNIPVLEVPLGSTYAIDIQKEIGRLELSAGSQRVYSSEIGLTKLIRDVRKVFHHAALALQHFPPFPLLFLPALERSRRAIERVDSASSRLSGSTRVSAMRVNVLRIHLRMSGKAGE